MNVIVINGKRITVEGNNVSVVNNRVYVDGKEVTDSALSGIVEIKWEGPLATLRSDASVSCGHVNGNVMAGMSMLAVRSTAAA